MEKNAYIRRTFSRWYDCNKITNCNRIRSRLQLWLKIVHIVYISRKHRVDGTKLALWLSYHIFFSFFSLFPPLTYWILLLFSSHTRILRTIQSCRVTSEIRSSLINIPSAGFSENLAAPSFIYEFFDQFKVNFIVVEIRFSTSLFYIFSIFNVKLCKGSN